MGQYWKVVNLDKKEFVHPHKLGSGLKLWEMLANPPGVGAALIVLTAAQREARGGGDFDMERNWHGPERTFPAHNTTPGPMPQDYPCVAARTIGRWAGDRIAIVGDYAEDTDLAPEFQASNIYELCSSVQNFLESADYHDKKARKARSPEAIERHRERARFFETAVPYTDISDDVCRVIEHELGGKFEGNGWRPVA